MRLRVDSTVMASGHPYIQVRTDESEKTRLCGPHINALDF